MAETIIITKDELRALVEQSIKAGFDEACEKGSHATSGSARIVLSTFGSSFAVFHAQNIMNQFMSACEVSGEAAPDDAQQHRPAQRDSERERPWRYRGKRAGRREREKKESKMRESERHEPSESAGAKRPLEELYEQIWNRRVDSAIVYQSPMPIVYQPPIGHSASPKATPPNIGSSSWGARAPKF